MPVSSTQRSDPELLGAVADGDRQALRVLYDRHAPWLMPRLARRCSDSAAVDDAVQDTFVAVWRGAGKYNGQGDVAAWIWGIAIRRLIDALRRRPRSEILVAEVQERRCVEEDILLGVEHGDLGGALQRLSPELRAVVQATILDDLTSREAGRLLGIPAGTVKTRMMRARAQLREELA
jgi:RNA polymerase sigma-70 factor (ECF subfamily)